MADHFSFEGASRYAGRFSDASNDHFHDLALAEAKAPVSSIGMGTYLGEPDDATDQNYEASLLKALSLGCNHIDTAVNYRFQRSERAVGRALQKAFADKLVSRDEVLVATKGGFIPFEDAAPKTREEMLDYYQTTFVTPGIITRDDIVATCHCMMPRYLRHQLEASLKNLQLDTVDVYYVHNPETQFEVAEGEAFYARLRDAFAELEKAVGEGKLRFYGTATWQGYRASPDSPGFLSLEKVVETAKKAGGKDHHFRFVQAPLNLAMPELATFQNQEWEGEMLSLLEAAEKAGVNVVASGSLLQGRLASQTFPEDKQALLKGCRTNAQRALQWTRSAPGLLSALCGTTNPTHAEENLELSKVPTLTEDSFKKLLPKT